MLISITSSKGGSGKTTLCSVLGANLFTYHGLKVAIADLDPQASLSNARKEDLMELKTSSPNSLIYQTATLNHEKHGMPFCHVSYIDLSKSFQEIKNKLDVLEQEYDVVVVDFPGSLNLNTKTLQILPLLDTIFIPLYVDRNSFSSTYNFYKEILQLKKEGKINGVVKCFFNKYNTGTKKNAGVFRDLLSKKNDLGLDILDNHVYEDTALENYSTIRKVRYSPAPKSILHWVEEIYNTIK